jgi:hypothetical protein
VIKKFFKHSLGFSIKIIAEIEASKFKGPILME